MTLEQIIRNRKGSAGSSRAWSVRYLGTNEEGTSTYQLKHYSTVMLTWEDYPARDGQSVAVSVAVEWSEGHGSVSDQNGMNKAFRVLNLPFYFSRRGGSQIVEISR